MRLHFVALSKRPLEKIGSKEPQEMWQGKDQWLIRYQSLRFPLSL
jgi:hypothetical protein